jgi:nudix-type nucleoside diphosphatase (YffH/AdpP family)
MDAAIIATETRYQGWSRLLIATVRLPTGETFRREIEDHGAAVAVLPYDPTRKVAILVRQFRAPVCLRSGMGYTLECVAGILDLNDAEACARREVSEEAGIELQSLEAVAATWTMPGISTERMHLFLATYSGPPRTNIGLGVASEHERISVEETDLGKLAGMADTGDVTDMKTLLLVQSLRLRHPHLFR